MDSTVDVNDGILESPTGELGRVITLSAVSLACRFCMHVMNRTTVRNSAALGYILQREEGQALVTVSNHTRCVGYNRWTSYPEGAQAAQSKAMPACPSSGDPCA
jgi:hypothetical protein